MTYLPQLGFMITITANNQESQIEKYLDFQFSNEEISYYKCEEMRGT